MSAVKEKEFIEKIVTRIMQERAGSAERMTLQEWSDWIKRLLENTNAQQDS